MDLRILERNVKLHRAYAESFKRLFPDIFARPLSESELVTLENATLCLSFMRLESIEATLLHEGKVQRAEEELLFMQQEVNAAQAELQRALAVSAKEVGLKVPAPGQGSLLRLEEEILALAKQSSTDSQSGDA